MNHSGNGITDEARFETFLSEPPEEVIAAVRNLEGDILVKNIIFMAGKKFGTRGTEELTWAMDTVVPGNAAFRYPGSRFVVYSTGCVYDFVSPGGGAAAPSSPILPARWVTTPSPPWDGSGCSSISVPPTARRNGYRPGARVSESRSTLK